jgi:NAD(P)-dependent dehydrogenase (short-subunit alcohol dehydrogenase family)
MLLPERTAVITGAASGIGLALSERCLAEGMSVVMADIESDVLHDQASRLKADGGSVTPVACDVSDAAQVDALRDAALAAHGSVHLLCNNAGVASGRPNLKTKPAVWDWVIGVNLLGAAYGCSAFGPLMVEQGEGHIVNTASEAGLASTPMLGSYHAAKYGVVGLSESLRMELEGTGVGVTCLCPELVATKIFESTRNAPAELGFRPPTEVPMEQLEQFMNTKAMSPADVAGQVLYAVQADKFWVITHQVTQNRVKLRNEDLEQRRNPTFRG